MVDVGFYDLNLLDNKIREFEYKSFPRTSYIKSRVNVIPFDSISSGKLLIELKQHILNAADPLESLVHIWLDAANKTLINSTRKSGTYFERHDCGILITGPVIRITKHFRERLWFDLKFIDVDGKKYMIIDDQDPTYTKFERLNHILTDQDFNEARLRW